MKRALVQLHEIKIILGAIGAFVVELEHAHVLLLDLHSTIIEWVCGMLASGHGDNHIRSQHCAICPFDTLWRYTKYSAHNFTYLLNQNTSVAPKHYQNWVLQWFDALCLSGFANDCVLV